MCKVACLFLAHKNNFIIVNDVLKNSFHYLPILGHSNWFPTLKKFFLKIYYSFVGSEVTQLCPTLCNTMEPTRLLCPWDFPGKSTGVGCHFLLQEIFPSQGLNPGPLHCKQTLYHLSHQGSPLFLCWYLTACLSPRPKLFCHL